MSISDGIIWDEQKGEEADSARMFINDVQIPVVIQKKYLKLAKSARSKKDYIWRYGRVWICRFSLNYSPKFGECG